MKRSKLFKIGIIAAIVIIIGLLFYKGAELFAPGSYTYSEDYKINLPKSVLIKKLQKFKSENPKFLVPDEIGVKDGMDESNLWYSIYFYYPADQQILHTLVRTFDDSTSKLSFHAVNFGRILGNWKRINKDLTKEENKSQKQKFKERIRDKIK